MITVLRLRCRQFHLNPRSPFWNNGFNWKDFLEFSYAPKENIGDILGTLHKARNLAISKSLSLTDGDTLSATHLILGAVDMRTNKSVMWGNECIKWQLRERFFPIQIRNFCDFLTALQQFWTRHQIVKIVEFSVKWFWYIHRQQNGIWLRDSSYDNDPWSFDIVSASYWQRGHLQKMPGCNTQNEEE